MSSSGLRVLRSQSTNPFFNLATEDWLLRNPEIAKQTLFLWRVDPTVVIGVHQNPWAECNIEAMEEDGVHLARRQSGGGAVYQDLGNTNFTFVSDKAAFDKDLNSRIVTDALDRHFGISAETSGRNDIVVDGKKVSGSAYKMTPDRGFHHGTMLMDVDGTAMGRYLTPSPLKLQAKGVASVQARVGNLTTFNPNIGHAGLCSALEESFFATHGGSCPIEEIDETLMAREPLIQKTFKTLASWAWRFGNTPKFTTTIEHKFDWGLVTVHLETTRGHVSAARVFSDCLIPTFVTAAEEALLGMPISIVGIEAFTKALVVAAPEHAAWATDMGAWLVKTLDV